MSSNSSQLQKKIKDIVNKSFTIKLIGKDVYKINAEDGSDYRNITKIFSELTLPWHSYENKQTRQIRVMAKDLHHSCQPEGIIQDLKNQGLKVTNAFNKLKFKTKEPLNMFTLCFDSSEDIKKIYEIKTILNTVVKIEQLKTTNIIPQCKSCQGFMHTKNYCCKPPKCVKCAGNHLTSDCKKPDAEPPKCCNCGQNHPASYRGCEVAKSLQKIRDQKQKENGGEKSSKAQATSIQPVDKAKTQKNSTTTKGEQTFAEVVANTEKKSEGEILMVILQKIEKQFTLNQAILNRLEKLEQKVNGEKFE